jgi:hypothetical protein
MVSLIGFVVIFLTLNCIQYRIGVPKNGPRQIFCGARSRTCAFWMRCSERVRPRRFMLGDRHQSVLTRILTQTSIQAWSGNCGKKNIEYIQDSKVIVFWLNSYHLSFSIRLVRRLECGWRWLGPLPACRRGWCGCMRPRVPVRRDEGRGRAWRAGAGCAPGGRYRRRCMISRSSHSPNLQAASGISPIC